MSGIADHVVLQSIADEASECTPGDLPDALDKRRERPDAVTIYDTTLVLWLENEAREPLDPILDSVVDAVGRIAASG